MAKAKFFSTKPKRGGKMLFLRGRQIGSIYFDKVGCFYWLSLKTIPYQEFATFEDAELFAWMNGAAWF